MNKFYKIIILIATASIGYILGQYVPSNLFKPQFEDTNLSKGEYYELLVLIISAVITFLAVLVALFKEDIRERWKRPNIVFNLPAKHTIEDIRSTQESGSGIETIKANRYLTRIEIENKGNLPALNSEMYLEKLEFTPWDSTIAQNIECSSAPLDWKGTESQTIIIPPGGRKIIDIVEISAPEIISTPNSTQTNNKAQLVIGMIENEQERTKGKWKAKFGLYAQNHRPVSFEIELEWDGVWKNRYTEFCSHFQIKKS